MKDFSKSVVICANVS